MSGSIFTAFHPTPVGRATWYKIRPLTMDDVIFTEWKLSQPATYQSCDLGNSLGNPRASCCMKIKPEAFTLLPATDKMVAMDKRIVEDFIRAFEREGRWPTIEVEVKYVGVRKQMQWVKFNDALLEVKSLHAAQKDYRQQLALDDMNAVIMRYVDEANRRYLQDAVYHYSRIESYDGQVLDAAAGNCDLNAQIRDLSKQLGELKERRNANRQQALKNYWETETPNDSLPPEAVVAVRQHVREKGFEKPTDFFGRG